MHGHKDGYGRKPLKIVRGVMLETMVISAAGQRSS